MDDGSPPVAKKNEDDQDDEQDRGAHRKNDIPDGFADGVGGIEGYLILHSGREVFGKAIEFGYALLVDVERVGGGELSDGDADGVASVVVEVGGVVFSAEFGVADIFEADQSAIGIALEDDLIELLGLGQTTNGSNADLEILARHGGLS